MKTELEPESETESKHEPLVYSGSCTGLLKGLNLGKRTVANFYGPNELDKNQEIEKIEILNKNVFCAMKNGGMKLFSGNNKIFKFPVKLWKKEKFGESWAGAFADSNSEKIIGISDLGFISTWNFEDVLNQQQNNTTSFEQNKTAFEESVEVAEASSTKAAVGGCVKCSARKNNFVALGGKETQLQLFDLNHPNEAAFKAKNCKPDKLQLHIPIHFPAVALPQASESIACTAYGSLTNQAHEFRIYDPRVAQRRPVKRIEWERHPIMSMTSIDPDGNEYAFGNARGKMGTIDLRNERIRPLKGPAGMMTS